MPRKEGSQFLSKIGTAFSERLFGFSTLIFVFSALVVQFIDNLITAIVLKLFSVSFIYSLFDINFHNIDASKWTVRRIIFVFGISTIIIFISGLGLLSLKVRNWKFNLVRTWLAFLMITLLPLNILSGLIFFQGFGIAWQWLVPSFIYRIVIGATFILAVALSRPYWVIRFLRTSYTRSVVANGDSKRQYILTVFILPYIAGLIILAPFIFPSHNYSWAVCVFGISLVVLPYVPGIFPKRAIKLYRNTNKEISATRTHFIISAVVLVLIWAASMVQINM